VPIYFDDIEHNLGRRYTGEVFTICPSLFASVSLSKILSEMDGLFGTMVCTLFFLVGVGGNFYFCALILVTLLPLRGVFCFPNTGYSYV